MTQMNITSHLCCAIKSSDGSWMALIIAGASPSRWLGVRPHLCRRLVDYWRIYRYEWRQWRNFLGRLCNNWKWPWHGGGQIRVRLVFRPPMQVLLESVVACHWAQALQRMGIVEQLSCQVDLWLGHRVTVGSSESFILTWSASSAAYGGSMELTDGVILNWRCFTS